VADVSGTGEGGQSIGRGTDERVGLGLLSRFIGAVFLVLLGGLLLLDRALLRANRNQAQLDAQSAALLAESFLARHMALLDRVEELSNTRTHGKDSVTLRGSVERLMATAPAARQLWINNPAGRQILGVTSSIRGRSVPLALSDSLYRLPGVERTQVAVARAGEGSGWIVLTRGTAPTSGRATGMVGMVVDGDSLGALLRRMTPDTRLSLVLLSAADTVVRLGDPARAAEALSDRVPSLARLPNGGTWQVVATHALTSRSLRWGLWALGVMGVVFLAIGLLREHQRALQVADRSIELERLYSDVKRANQAKSEFLANVSHELRTPLNAIGGYTDLLLAGVTGELSDTQSGYLERLRRSQHHLLAIINDLLNFSRIEAGRLDYDMAPMSIGDAVRRVLPMVEPQAVQRGLRLAVTETNDQRVVADSSKVEQILLNLLSNAIKFTPPGGSITVEQFGEAKRTGVRVADTGIGIEESQIESIFEPFVQVGRTLTTAHEGTGLGLAISRELARGMQGDLTATSSPGVGSAFELTLKSAE
jgi:signal transduction histidine kinase